MEEAGVAASNYDSIGSWGSLTGARSLRIAKPSHREGGSIQVPFEDRVEVGEEGLGDDLLIARADAGQAVAQAADGVTHHHIVAEKLIRGRHFVSLSFLHLQVPRRAAGDHVLAQDAVVLAEVPPLHLLQPGSDVNQVGDEIRIVCAAGGGRDEWDHVHSEVKELGESAELCAQAFCISNQTFLHEVGEGSNEKNASLRKCEVAEKGIKNVAELTEEGPFYSDDRRALLIQRGHCRRHILVRKDDQLPSFRPLRFVALPRQKLVSNVTAAAHPVLTAKAC